MSSSAPSAETLSPGLVSTSADEVERVLAAVLAQRELLTVQLGGQVSATKWRLSFVDSARKYIIVEHGSGKSASAELLEHQRVTFVAEVGDMLIEFTALHPRRVKRGGVTSIRLTFPKTTVSRQRRVHARARVLPAVLHCAIPAGAGVALEGQIVDISQGGAGLLVRATYLVPAPGTLIKGWRIDIPERAAVLADFEVRYCRTAVLADGGQAQHWGCRFVNPSDEVNALIGSFGSE